MPSLNLEFVLQPYVVIELNIYTTQELSKLQLFGALRAFVVCSISYTTDSCVHKFLLNWYVRNLIAVFKHLPNLNNEGVFIQMHAFIFTQKIIYILMFSQLW